MNQPLVSVIVTTYNNHATLDACLRSITEQTYPKVELLVVDNNSTDDTKEIAKRHTQHVFNKGPERSTQRNYGARKATGDYVVIIDSDMVLDQRVVANCVEKIEHDTAIKGIVIPEESFGQGFWAQCKKLERSFYVGISWMEAARFFDRATYQKLGGYNEQLVSGEDWDLSQRVAANGKLGHIDTYIFHNEGRLHLRRTLQKKYYYARLFTNYLKTNKQTAAAKSQTGVFTRYKLFLSQPKKLFQNPIHGAGMLFMKTCEFGFGAVGFLSANRKEHE